MATVIASICYSAFSVFTPNNAEASNFFAPEICNNGIDDDLDGLIDCADSDCRPVITHSIIDCQPTNADINLTVTNPNTPTSYRWSDMTAEALWQFNNNTTDGSGNGHNQTSLTGTASYDASDKIEGSHSFVFNGSTFIRYGQDGGFLETAYSARTYSLWIKPTNLTGTKILFEQGGSTRGLACRLNGNILTAALRTSGSASQRTTGNLTFPNDGAWHHVAVVFNNGNLTCYLDGVASTTVTAAVATIPADGNNDAIGVRNGTDAFGSTTASNYSGKMDDVRLYYSALSAQRVADLARNDGDRLNLTAGTYTVTVTSSTGCTATRAITMTIPCTEICNNSSDDDGDGTIDCNDADCNRITLSALSVSACINQPLQDVATVSLNVAWTTPPANDSIVVSIYGKKRYVATGSAAGNQTITMNVPANGTTNNTITAYWINSPSLCQRTTTYNAPAACSNDQINCNILYLCGNDKPYDGDAWDHGFIEYLDEVNGSNSVMPILTKADASGYGTYDPMNPSTFVNVNFNNYNLIVISATTEGYISTGLVNYLKNSAASIINCNYLIINDLGMAATEGGYQFQSNAYINNTTLRQIYDYHTISPYYGMVLTKADVVTGGTGSLWANANNMTSNTNAIIFAYDKADVLPGVNAGHGSRVYIGYHMNGIYVGGETGYVLPAPVETYLNPAKHFTLDGKNYFDQAILLAAADCNILEICNNGIDDNANGLVDCADTQCPVPPASISGTNTLCTGGSTTLTATGGSTYAWSTGATSTSITVTPSATTTYTVTVTNANGCTAISNRTVTVSACPEICNNSIDDDGDGLIDAADPDCIACPAPSSAPYILQEYFLPYPEDQVFNAFKTIFPSNLGCGNPTAPNVSAPLRCYISVAPYLNSTIVYYDQWEDGYETEITMPMQASTKIWGDGNPANGIPPGFATDVINAGQAIVLQNNINPSNLTLVDYDGRDRIGVSKPVSITKSHWASGSETLLAGTMLVYPTTDWGTFFKIPIGENVNTSIQSFSYSGFSVMAHQNGTTVNIDANADGAFETNITLNKGQAHQVNGGVLKGARIQASLPVQVYLTAGDVCDFYENRWFNIPPLDSWGNYFFGPVSGTDKLYAIYNPNASSITIRGKSSSGNLADQTIAANGVAFTTGIANSGFQFFSKDGSPFLVLAMSDAVGSVNSANKMFDWGSTLLPEAELNQQVIVGWAPGHDPNYSSSENSAPVWATVSSANGSSLVQSAKVCVDYDGDGVGSLTDSYGRSYDVALNLAPLVSQKVYDPDGDQTNMLLYVCDGSNALISAVWGQDALTASPASPGLDLGNGIPGIKSFYAYKTGSLFNDVNSNSLFNIGDVVQYKIGIANQGLVQTTGSYNVKDLLPSQVTYVAGSTQLTKPGPVVSAILDAGSTIFPLDEGGSNINVTLNPGQEAFITFLATVNSKPPAPGYVTNLATVSKSGLVYDLNWSFCVTVSPEICGNSIDDDQDGLTDCNDPDCFVSGAAGGGTVCLGSTISLTASGGTSYNWSGPAAFTSTAQNPTRANATALMSGNYTVTITGSGCTTTKTVAVNVSNCSPASASCDALSCTGPSLISAGTFESFSTGSPGFTSDFNYVNCGSISNGYYSVLQSAANCSGTWAAAPDHTTGNGNGKYLVADFATTSPGQNGNGNATSGELFCSASIPVNANTNYCFSGWFLKLCASCTGEPDIKFMVNGIQVGTVSGAAFNTGGWTKKGFSFLTSDFGNPATITVSIAQNAFGTNGFDLALDDIELREILSGTTPTVVGDVVTSCTATPLTINVLANDTGYTASTLTIVSQPPTSAGTVSKSGTNLLFTPVPGFSGQASFTYSVCGAVNGCCAQGSVTVNIAPVSASASSDTPVCAGVDLHLTGSGGNTYAWTGPNGFTANTAYATINNATVAASGTYTVTVTNSAGCTAQATVVATVNACATNRKPECNCN
jgi:uncharacterized repeat protein (TIGR01451 family)